MGARLARGPQDQRTRGLEQLGNHSSRSFSELASQFVVAAYQPLSMVIKLF